MNLNLGGGSRKEVKREKRKAKINKSKTRATKTEAHRLYTEANQEVKRSVKCDKKDFIERLADQAEEAAGQRNLKELYDITRTVAGIRLKDEQQVIDKTGQSLTNQADQINRRKEYFEELLNRPSPDEPPVIPPDIPPAETPLRINTDRRSQQEIRKAILQLKNGKAPVPDGIPPEEIKADTGTSVGCLYPLFGKIWVEEEIPQDRDMATCSRSPRKAI